MIEVADYSVANAEERANKFLPSEDDMNASTQLEQNTFIRMLRENPDYVAAVKKYRVSWSFDPEIARNIFSSLKTTAEYQEYIKHHDTAIGTEKDIIKFIFKKYGCRYMQEHPDHYTHNSIKISCNISHRAIA